MNGLNSLSVLENDIQSLAQKVYTGKELDRVNAFYEEHCEAVERDLKVLQILKENRVDLDLIDYWMTRTTTPEELLYKYNDRAFDWAGDLTTEEMTQIVEWLKEK